jgi:phosphopantetheinyl transferase
MNWQPLYISNVKKENLPEILVVYGTGFPKELGIPENFLTHSEIIKFNSGKNKPQNSTRIACRATLRWLLSIYTGISPKYNQIIVNCFGKPCIPDSGVFFNVSHTSFSFLVGVLVSGRIGTDIELLKGDENLQEISEYAFSGNEEKALFDDTSFLKIWTQKEALLKAAGLGLTNNLQNIDSDKLITKWGLNAYSFSCPNNEIASVVVRAKSQLESVYFI